MCFADMKTLMMMRDASKDKRRLELEREAAKWRWREKERQRQRERWRERAPYFKAFFFHGCFWETYFLVFFPSLLPLRVQHFFCDKIYSDTPPFPRFPSKGKKWEEN